MKTHREYTHSNGDSNTHIDIIAGAVSLTCYDIITINIVIIDAHSITVNIDH